MRFHKVCTVQGLSPLPIWKVKKYLYTKTGHNTQNLTLKKHQLPPPPTTGKKTYIIVYMFFKIDSPL